jgi:hypothetical protein
MSPHPKQMPEELREITLSEFEELEDTIEVIRTRK